MGAGTLRVRGWVWLSLWFASGCFGPGSGGGTPDAGDSQAAGRGGLGGGAGFGTAGGRAVGGGGGVGMPALLCGDQVCIQPEGSTLQACCTASGACSFAVVGAACGEMPAADPDCGTFTLAVGISVPGCCMDGMCGLNAAMFGMGCEPLETFTSLGIMLEARTCGGSGMDAGLADDDAGR